MLSDREALTRASHELRTPLQAILGFGQLLALDPLSESQRHSVEQIIAGGRHLLTLIEDLLDLSRVGQLAVGPVDLREEIAHAIALCRPLCTICRVCRVCDVECSCGPCNIGGGGLGGLSRFSGLGG